MVETNTKELIRIVQETCAKEIQIGKSITIATSKLETIVQESKKAQDIYQNQLHLNNQLDKKIYHLDDSLHKHEATIECISKNIENVCCKQDNVQWHLAKAKFILANENSKRLKYQQIMEQYTNKLSTNTVTSNLEISNQKEITLKKKMLEEKKHALEMEIKQKINSHNESFNAEKENLVLKKRNNALLLRLKSQLQESENRHRFMLSQLQKLQRSAKYKASILNEQKLNKDK